MNSNWSYSPETPNLGRIRRVLELCDLEIWRMIFNKANLRDLIAATGLVISNWIQIVNFSACVTVKFDGWPCNKANLRDLIAATGLAISNWIQIVNFSARVTVKFDGWPCKTIGHLFYATSSFVHHFVAIGEFKLELQSWNAQSGSNWMIFRAVRPWNLTDDLAIQ